MKTTVNPKTTLLYLPQAYQDQVFFNHHHKMMSYETSKIAYVAKTIIRPYKHIKPLQSQGHQEHNQNQLRLVRFALPLLRR